MSKKITLSTAFKMWYARWFKVITNQQAVEWQLTHAGNVYGDWINRLNCRSIWKDSKGRAYRVALLKQEEVTNEQ